MEQGWGWGSCLGLGCKDCWGKEKEAHEEAFSLWVWLCACGEGFLQLGGEFEQVYGWAQQGCTCLPPWGRVWPLAGVAWGKKGTT